MLGELNDRAFYRPTDEFQSLFCWIVLGEDERDDKIEEFVKFQSLFCWIVLGEVRILKD